MDDKRIIEAFWRRDEQAIRLIEERYGSLCMGVAINILSVREDAEECVNDVYDKAWNAIPPHRPDNLMAYLARLTRNAALDRLDYLHACRRDARLCEVIDELGDCAGSSDSAERQYEQGRASGAISDFLRSIDKRSRMVFVRRYWFSDSIKEIAVRYSMTQSGVKSMLARTRRKLKAYLTEEGIDL